MEKTFKQINSSCIKLVLYGPESTGKSTLSIDLAKYYNTVYVPEYAREYLQNKWDQKKGVCSVEDLLPIALGQIESENRLAKEARNLLICDTDLIQTMVYSKVYYDGYCNPKIQQSAIENSYDLYFLCSIDVPWMADDLRDKPHEREFMFSAFKVELEKLNRPFVILEGSHDKRMQQAIKSIDQLLIEKKSNK